MHSAAGSTQMEVHLRREREGGERTNEEIVFSEVCCWFDSDIFVFGLLLCRFGKGHQTLRDRYDRRRTVNVSRAGCEVGL